MKGSNIGSVREFKKLRNGMYKFKLNCKDDAYMEALAERIIRLTSIKEVVVSDIGEEGILVKTRFVEGKEPQDERQFGVMMRKISKTERWQ
ncbi:MAG: hypothetical protein M1504_00810 [Candidatus Marsarchaeota archaeon]|nr:hypothetical protein [Candidatus Marsarchaeota archaeon]